MKVKELIEKLSEYNGDLEVAIYVNEDMDAVRVVSIEEEGKDRLYCKVDHYLDYKPELKTVVVIRNY